MSQSNFLTAHDLARLMFNRLKRHRYIIIASALIGGLLFGIYAANSPVTYTSTATIFSLNSSNDNPTTTSNAISQLLGGEASKSFSDETSINIIELAQSRAINEAVAAMPVPSMENKIVASLLIDDINEHRGLIQKKIIPPNNKEDLIILAAIYLKSSVTATINKNNSFVLNYTGRSEDLVKVISYGLIDKISQFYIDIKREKAKRDYEFATAKVDSLRRVMGVKDNVMIAMDKQTLFTNTERLEYRMPAENLEEDKQLIRNQYSQAVINQQTAAYKLQKDTPLIKVLDKPDPPFEKNGKSIILFSIIGVLAASIIVSGLITGRLFFRYTRQEVSRAIFGIPAKTTATSAS